MADLEVQCSCGWTGKQSELLYAPMTNSEHCPKCKKEFKPFPPRFQHDLTGCSGHD